MSQGPDDQQPGDEGGDGPRRPNQPGNGPGGQGPGGQGPGGWSSPLDALVGQLFERLGRAGDGDPLGNLGDLLGGLGGGLGGGSPFGPEPGPPGSPARTPRLDRLGRDLTAEARAGRLDPVVGRDREVGAVLEVLARRSKNNPVLVGDPGVGKTAVVEGIAARIAAGRVPQALVGARVVSVDLAGAVAGTKYRGEFEQRLRDVVDEVTRAGRSIILFLDEIHTLVGAGAGVEGGMDAADILKPALARGELQVVGATTLADYRKHIESDAALERRFAPIMVDEPSVATTVAILDGLAPRYEDHHDVRIPADARRAAAELGARHIPDRFLPDKAIDAMDTAASRVRLAHTTAADADRRADAARRVERLTREQAAAVEAEAYERAQELRAELDAARRERDAPPTSAGRPTVTVADVAAVVADLSGVPVAHLTDPDRERLLGLAERLGRRVVGQDEARELVADAVVAGRAGMSDPQRPVASFLFAGPTGVGKTELARALAEALHGSDERIVRVDLGEFREAHTVHRLTGAPPGYVGHDRPGELTDAVRRTPSCVVLLDEIEKAHADVLALLLGVLDAGRLTDGQGRVVSFTDTVVIMTTNLGAGELAAGKDPEAARPGVTAALTRVLRPEFLGRIDETVLFTALTDDELHRVVRLLLDGTRARLAAQGVGLTVTPDAVAHLATRGHDRTLGARPLRQLVTREVDRALARRLVAGAVRSGQHVTVGVSGETLTFDVEA